MAEQPTTLDEIAMAVLVVGADGGATAEKLAEAIEAVQTVRRSVSLFAELHGVAPGDVLDRAHSLLIVREASAAMAAGVEVIR